MIKKPTRGELVDGTVYRIEDGRLIINSKTWFKGTKEEIEKYIQKLNEE